MKERLRVVPHGRPALDVLDAVVADLKAGDPLAPVTVTPPGTFAALALRRVLGRRQPLVNTQFMPLIRVAELLGAPALAAEGRRPLTPTVLRAAVRSAVADEPGIFEPVAAEPATVDALTLACTELAPAGEDGLDLLSRRGRRAAEVVRVVRAVNERLRGYYDRVEVARSAARAVSEGTTALRDVGTVVLHLPHRLAPHDLEIVERLAEADRLVAVLGLTGDQVADDEARRLEQRLASLLGPASEVPVPSSRPPARAVVTPSPEEELRVVARDLLTHVRAGVPLYRVAVLSARSEPYSLVAADVLTEAGVDWHGPDPRTLAHTVAGRVLLGALSLPGLDYARHDVAAWLESGPIVESLAAGGLTGGALDAWSRRAGITAGEARWRSRLGGLARRLDSRAAEYEADGDLEGAARRRGEAEEVRRVASFVDDLFAALRPPGAPSWSAYAEWGDGLLRRFLGGDASHAAWPDHEIEALRLTREALEALGGLDVVDGAPDLATFHQALEDELATPAPRRTAFGRGVFVGRVDDAVGADFDVVYVVGMSEGNFPRPVAEGSLVSEADREALGDAFPSRAERRRADRHAFLAALATAPQQVLTAPATDPRAGRPVHPSPWFDGAGAPVEILASPLAGLHSGPDPASPTELDLRHLVLGDQSTPGSGLELTAGFDATQRRAAGAAGPWTGFTGPGAAAIGPRSSPTSLETWAACGYRYFLAHVLGVSDRDDPEELETIAAHERGNLVHGILEEFIGERVGRMAPRDTWSVADRERLDQIAAEHFTQFEERGLTGRPVLWDIERSRIRRDLHAFLDADAEVRAMLGVAPAEVELSFRPGEGTPVRLDVGEGESVEVGGRIDRVDVAPDRSAVWVVDYKTGSPISRNRSNPFEPDPFIGGTKLQLPVYALAARQALGLDADTPIHADYWYVTTKGGFRREGFTVTRDLVEAYTALIGAMSQAITDGVFPARPGGETYDFRRRRYTHDHCLFCPYDRVCPADRADTWARLESQPEARAYLDVVGPPGDDDDPDEQGDST